MPSLRRRLRVATGALLAVQVAGTVLGFASYARVRDAGVVQAAIGDERQDLLELARAARELYVHQAHTFIEGGPDHLDHLDHDSAHVDAALAALLAHGGPIAVDVAAIRGAVEASTRWFAADVVPLARDGRLDRPAASALHREAEAHAARVQAAIDDQLARLADAEATEVQRVELETRRAQIAVALILLGGLGVAGVVTRGLARRILDPIDALRRAVRAFAEGEAVDAPPGGDEELQELGGAFNEMVGRVREAEARRVARERVEALGEIAAAVAHELMSPVSAILVETRGEPPDVGRIRAEADHARRVIQGLLGYARPGEAEPVDVRVADEAAAAVERAVPLADTRGVTVTFVGGDGTTLRAAPTAVRQVLDNLVRNAVDASTEGGAVEVEVRDGAVEVRDRGAGVPDAVRARLYQPFVSGRVDGTGLGLAVSQRIAVALGGRIAHLDRAGGGTVARWGVSGG